MQAEEVNTLHKRLNRRFFRGPFQKKGIAVEGGFEPPRGS